MIALPLAVGLGPPDASLSPAHAHCLGHRLGLVLALPLFLSVWCCCLIFTSVPLGAGRLFL